jgi:hypothetical protein
VRVHTVYLYWLLEALRTAVRSCSRLKGRRAVWLSYEWMKALGLV